MTRLSGPHFSPTPGRRLRRRVQRNRRQLLQHMAEKLEQRVMLNADDPAVLYHQSVEVRQAFPEQHTSGSPLVFTSIDPHLELIDTSDLVCRTW